MYFVYCVYFSFGSREWSLEHEAVPVVVLMRLDYWEWGFCGGRESWLGMSEWVCVICRSKGSQSSFERVERASSSGEMAKVFNLSLELVRQQLVVPMQPLVNKLKQYHNNIWKHRQSFRDLYISTLRTMPKCCELQVHRTELLAAYSVCIVSGMVLDLSVSVDLAGVPSPAAEKPLESFLSVVFSSPGPSVLGFAAVGRALFTSGLQNLQCNEISVSWTSLSMWRLELVVVATWSWPPSDLFADCTITIKLGEYCSSGDATKFQVKSKWRSEYRSWRFLGTSKERTCQGLPVFSSHPEQGKQELLFSPQHPELVFWLSTTLQSFCTRRSPTYDTEMSTIDTVTMLWPKHDWRSGTWVPND